MKYCTFLGHRNTPNYIESILQATLIRLIEQDKIHMFYAGNQGKFDGMVLRILKSLKQTYSQIEYYVVLAYMPTNRTQHSLIVYSDTIFPEGLELVPPRYAIIKRNKWMIEKSDYVVTFVRHTTGDAAKFKVLAERKGKHVINLA